jgi:uncharacterized protein YfaS (alpha-2-macroglobulin family)
MKDEPELRKRIQDAIYRVLNYQSSGSFGLWGQDRATSGSTPTCPIS